MTGFPLCVGPGNAYPTLGPHSRSYRSISKLEKLVGNGSVRFFDLSPQEAEVAQRLGAALIIKWNRVPNDLQSLLIQQAADVGGFGKPMAQMDLQISQTIVKLCQKK